MRITIDIDSTLHHYWDVLSEAARNRFGIELPYDEQLTWGITRLKPEQLELCIAETHCAEAILAGRPYPAAVETVNRWKRAGHFIQITSHRSPDAHDATAQWLAQIGLEHDELHCSDDKVARCRELGIELLIDDAPDTIREAIDHGLMAATLLHPWNEDVVAEEGVLAAPDWPTLAALLEEHLAPLRATG